MYLPLLWSLLAVLSFPLLSTAVTQNVTIDDTQTVGDTLTGAHIIYYVADQWCGCNQQTNCTDACLFMGGAPDTSIALDHTWHQAGNTADNVKMDVLFTGTAVYVYTILSSGWKAINITFMMDGKTASHFTQDDEGISFINTFAPNFTMFSATGLSSTKHNLTILMGSRVDKKLDNLSVFTLDYIIYSFESNITSSSTTSSPTAETSPTPTPSTNPITSTTHSKTPVIIGSVIGTIAAVSIILFILLRFLHTKKHSHERPTPIIPFDTQEYQPSVSTGINASKRSPGGLKGVAFSDSTSGAQSRTPSSSDTSDPSGSIGEQQSENRSQAAMTSMEATMSLATEVQRLRAEVDRLNRTRSSEVGDDAPGTFPPPYQAS